MQLKEKEAPLHLPTMYFDDHELDRYGLREGDVVVCEGGEPGRAAVWKGHDDDIKYQKAVHRVRFDIAFGSQLPMPVADYAEQQKIADCLSSLDELIAATTAQRQHKKGMLQQLFLSPAEDMP